MLRIQAQFYLIFGLILLDIVYEVVILTIENINPKNNGFHFFLVVSYFADGRPKSEKLGRASAGNYVFDPDRLGTIEILQNAQKVCKSWYRVCKDPSIWKKIDIENRTDEATFKYNLESMCRHAVDRSQGGLTEIEIWSYGSDDLIKYIANRSSNLRSLGLVRCFPITDEGVAEAVAKLPLLEELRITYCLFPGKSLRAIGQSCPNLKTLRLNCNPDIAYFGNELDSNAISIAESMPILRHLQLLGNGITNLGLKAILDGCPHLEHLDLRKCYNINLVGDLKKQCLEKIKDLRRPNESTADCPFDVNHHGTDSDEDYTNEGYDTGMYY